MISKGAWWVPLSTTHWRQMTSVLFYEFLELSDSLFSGAKTTSGHGNNHYCMDQKHMDRLRLLKLDCCNMQIWVQWGVVKELAMVETRKAESRMGSRWEEGTDGRKGGTEIGKRVKGLAGRLIPYLTISTTIWTAQSWALKPASKSFELLM